MPSVSSQAAEATARLEAMDDADPDAAAYRMAQRTVRAATLKGKTGNPAAKTLKPVSQRGNRAF